MPSAAAPSNPQPLEMIEAMTSCAYELGLAAAGIAKGAEGDTALFLAASAEYRHCFFAVRMGIRLAQATRAGSPVADSVRAGFREAAERERPERVETRDDVGREPEGRDDVERDRDRDRESEPVSLPQFLKSLGVAATSAERRGGALPAHVRDTTLPALRGLLRQTTATPTAVSAGAGVAVLVRPPTVPAARSRLLSSAGVPPRPLIAPARRPSG